MTGKRAFKSDAFESIHATAMAFHEIGVADAETMRAFDALCLAETPVFEPAQIRQLRENLNVSQPVFARYLKTSESTVEKWETGAKKPSGTALKLLAVVRKHGLQVLA